MRKENRKMLSLLPLFLTNTMITEIEQTILQASINNQTINTTNILGISEDLQYLIQSNMEDWVF